MEIQKRITADCWEFILSGRVDGAVANQLEVEVLAAMKQNAKTIYVNLAEATFLCSAGIRVLLQYHRQMKNKGLVLLATRIPRAAASGRRLSEGRPLAEIFRQPRLIVAVVCGVASYSMMNLVMTSAPVAMLDCHHTINDETLGLQWHVIGMFAPSFFTGALIARFGTDRVAGCGLAIIAAGALIALAGLTIWHFWAALVLLGVGWNFAFVGATALVTQCHRPNERNKVQAVNDFLVFGSMAIGSFASGHLLASYGWDMVAEVVLPVVVVAAVLLIAVNRRARPQPV